MLCATKIKMFRLVRGFEVKAGPGVQYATNVNSHYFVAFRNLSEALRDPLHSEKVGGGIPLKFYV